MATHSSIVAWRTPWTEEPGRLQSLGLQKVGMSMHAHTYGFMCHNHRIYELERI